MPKDQSPKDIIDFWFSESSKKLWFNSTIDFDSSIRTQFEETFFAAQNHRLTEWEETSAGSLALVIVLDQFPLNMYRGEAKSFSGEGEAIRISRNAINKNQEHVLSDSQKAFLFMPLMHSENLEDQDLSVVLYEKAGLTNNLRFAKHHREIVRKFGRFPHRNKILGRTSTEEEMEYLNSKNAFLG